MLLQVQAEDNDWADNGRLQYSMIGVSRNGRNKFAIHPQTGIIDAVGALNVGERYTITVQVRHLILHSSFDLVLLMFLQILTIFYVQTNFIDLLMINIDLLV